MNGKKYQLCDSGGVPTNIVMIKQTRKFTKSKTSRDV